MTQSIAINSDRDIFVDSRGNLAFVIGVDACAQNTVTAVSAQLGEMIYATDSGMPLQAVAFDNYDPLAFEIAAREIINRVRDVTGISAFAVSQTNDAITYTTDIQTIYGEVGIDGQL